MACVAVVGDIILDEFVYGDVHRISPEAATPVLSVTRSVKMLGGAGNVARGVQALGTDCSLVGVIGEDRAGHDLTNAMLEIDDPYIIIDKDRPTTHKTRYVSTQHSTHLLRVDSESTTPVSRPTEESIIARASRALFDADVLVISDYCKGVITNNVARALIAEATKTNKRVIVDSKRTDLSIFHGATIVKVNLCELGLCYDEPDPEVISRMAYMLADDNGFGHVIVTQGERGLSAYPGMFAKVERAVSKPWLHIPGKVVRVRDVSGAGDTVVATLAARLAHGQDIIGALHVANDAAAIAVSKPGTAVVTAAELNGGDIAPVGDWALLEQRLREWKGQRIGFTNGCFDLLHPGHVHLLMQARSQCDKLIVGLNSDSSVKLLKGMNRPINAERTRGEMLAALDNVDLVVVFDGATPTELVKLIRPDVMFKGDDYKAADVAGHEYASHVIIIPRIAGHSTTKTIERVK